MKENKEKEKNEKKKKKKTFLHSEVRKNLQSTSFVFMLTRLYISVDV